MNFFSIPSATSVFMDANVFVYSYADDPTFGDPCTDLLERIELKDLQGFVSASPHFSSMFPRTIEFETELTGKDTLSLPSEVAGALPPSGKATVVVIVDRDPDDAAWEQAAYQQFLRGDTAEDAVYDKYL